jgi:hypothetical protein
MQNYYKHHTNHSSHRIVQLYSIYRDLIYLRYRLGRLDLTNAYWYIDGPEIVACDPTADNASKKSAVFVDRWNRMKESKEIELYFRIHADICNVPLYLLSNTKLQIKFSKARTNLFLMNKDKKSNVEFKIQGTHLHVKRIRPNPAIHDANNETLSKGILARNNFTRVELKTFTHSNGSHLPSIVNAVLGIISKRLIFTMIKNTDFLGTVDTNLYNFRHYGLNYFVLYVNGRQIPPEGMSMGMDHEKTSVMGYKPV